MAAIVVLHGIGEQVRGNCGMAFAKERAKALSRQGAVTGPVTVASAGEHVFSVPGGLHDPVDVPVCFVYYVSNGTPTQDDIYEMHWAADRHGANSFFKNLFNAWQLFVGLPRLGIHALEFSTVGVSSWLGATARLCYYAAWTLLLVHLFANVLMLGFKWVSPLSDTRIIDIHLVLDLLLWSSFLMVIITIPLAWWFSKPRPVIFPALLALALTQMLTMVMEFALIDKTAAQPSLAAKQNVAAETSLFPFAVPSSWFYAANSWPGFLPYLNYGAVLIWGAVAGVWYLWCFFSVHTPPKIAVGRVDTLFRFSRWFWRVLCTLVLVLVPIVGWKDFLTLLCADNPPDLIVARERVESGPEVVTRIVGHGVAPLGLAPLGAATQVSYPVMNLPTDALQQSVTGLLEKYCTLVMIPFVALLVSLLFSSSVRKSLAPLVELGLDVMNYFPTLPLDRTPMLRYVFGGVRVPGFPERREELARSFACLVCDIHARTNGPLLVVSHSLGSIIALTGLEYLSSIAKAPPVSVDLVTFGSPLELLQRMFPLDFGRSRSISMLASWRNYYRTEDLVGRGLGEPSKCFITSVKVEDVPLGSGGHTGYFADTKLADLLLK